ncbi:predicted protein [Uncinocarpus reesii 1704]|uniref:F-box domain-containing protein n=1 Tax=Uncinocarpus reesii (strain UAMH 1704) TaxID=336963 RepID=C4JPY5_UNCRE|nr:uncharacterized protein UREG_04628 [Uncinocarpus reesii 1704]EEP79782.1 predicted protein [Uncinocarpus reesii 1704]
METTLHKFTLHPFAMYIVDMLGLSPASYSRGSPRRMDILYSLLSLWNREPSKPTPPRLDLMSLPPEIILCVGDHLNEKDLTSLIGTARTFAELLSPKLYDFIVGCGTPESTFKEDILVHAGRWNSHYALNYFRTKRADVLLRMDPEGGLLLNRVARAGNAKLVSILLERGADVNGHSNRDLHALTLAAKYGHEDIVRILLDAGAEVDVFHPCKKTLLHAIYRYGHRNSPVVSQLLIDRLQERGQISQRDSQNATPLHYAVRYNRAYAVPQLIKAGADLKILNNDGLSVLDIALRHGKMKIVRQLLETFPGPWPSYYVQKAIWEAADRLDLDALERIAPLIKAGNVLVDISLSQRSRAGLTALHVAARGPQDWLRSSDHAFSRESSEVVLKWEKMIDLLLNMGANISTQDCIGRTPFFFAVEHGNPERIPFLLQRLGETISIRDNLGRTALHAAVHNDKSELTVRHLLRAGLDINAQDSQGQTALHYASTCPVTVPTVEYLVNAGADASICDKHGYPASHFAANQRRNRALKVFIDAGVPLHSDCDVCYRNSQEWRTENGEWMKFSEPLDLSGLFDHE